MTDTESARGDESHNAQPMESEGQADCCPNCKETYCWIYGEDRMPTSLSCGHTICFRCAQNQWHNPESEDFNVLCATCSVHVAVTTYKSLPTSRPEMAVKRSAAGHDVPTSFIGSETTPSSSSKTGGSEAAGDNHGTSEGEPVQSTPVHHRSSTEVIQQHSSEGKQNSSTGHTMDRVTSTLSSPLVLDKIQSQDDAWRLLQHDEGFIRDWIVANVPDHVIFKMVGAGSSDGAMDGGSFVIGNSSAVVVASPSKMEDMTMVTPETTGMTCTTSVLGGSGSQGETLARNSFEQQFLQYLVSKATPQEKLANTVDVSREHGLPGPLTTVDNSAQTGHNADRGALPQDRSSAMEIMKQSLKHLQPRTGVGSKSDFSVPQVGKASSQLPNELIGMQTEGEACRLAAVQSTSSQNVMSETDHYDSSPNCNQSLPALQVPSSAYSSGLPSTDSAYSSSSAQNLYQQNYGSQTFSGASRNIARFPGYSSQRSVQPLEPGAFSRSRGLYSSYPYQYSQHSHYPWKGQYGQPYARIQQRFQPGPFQRFSQYTPHRGPRFGRDCGTVYSPSPFRLPAESTWSSKACTTALNPPSAPSMLSAPPQIRFVQVVRPKPDSVVLSEPSREEDDDAVTSCGQATEAALKEETPTTESQEETEAEVALMKTRAMPHGTQVEDIYVVPQVWLTSGQGPMESLQQTECPACPCPAIDSPFKSPTLCAVRSTVSQGIVCPPSSKLSPGKTPVMEHCNDELSNSVGVPVFADSKVRYNEQVPEMPSTSVAAEAASNGVLESAQEKNATDDGTDYTDFKPVAVVTTVSVSKTSTTVEPKVERMPPELSNLPPPPLISSSSMTTAPLVSDNGTSTWDSNMETPDRETATITDGLRGEGSIGQVPSAPVKKMDRNFEQRHSTQHPVPRPNIVPFPHKQADISAPTFTSSCSGGPFTKTARDTLVPEATRHAETDTQTALSLDEVEILEGRSSLPSAIMFPKQNASEVSQGRKRLRRNLNSEFYNSDQASSYYVDRDRRAYGRNGRWYPSKYIQYNSAYYSPQQAPYPYGYSGMYGPRPHYYNALTSNAQNPALNCRHPHQYPEFFPPNPEQPSNYQFDMYMDDTSLPRQPGAVYSLLQRSGPVPTYPSCRPLPHYSVPLSHSFHSSLSQTYPDVLSHLSSGRGDYSNTSSVFTQTKTPPDCQQNCSIGRKADLGCSLDDSISGSGVRQRQFRPDKEQSSDGTGDGCHSVLKDRKVGPVRHRVPPQDLDTVRWIQQEIGELNKEIDSSLLTRLEGCLALLRRNAYQEFHVPVASNAATAVQDLRDMDHLWRCILSLGKVVVQYGWWCQPHVWDTSSERWAEMALLASSVFTQSMKSLTEVITFYLDHVCTFSSHDMGAQEEVHDQRVSEIPPDDHQRSVESSTSLVSPCAEHQHQANNSQPEYVDMFPKGQTQVLRTGHGHSSCNTALETSELHIPAYADPHHVSSSVNMENQFHTVTVDPPESYIPHPSVFSQYGDDSPSAAGSESYSGDTGHTQAAFPVEDHSIASREREVPPAVVYHYQVSNPPKETHRTEHERHFNSDPHISPGSEGRAPVWNPDSKQISSCCQFSQAHCSKTPRVEQPDPSADPSSLPDSLEDSTMITVSSPGLNQTQVEVYYTMEGTLIDGIAPDTHIITAAQSSCSNEGGENIVYTVSQLAETENPSELCTENTVNYILSTEVDEPTQQSEPQQHILVKTEAISTISGDTSPLPDTPYVSSEPTKLDMEGELPEDPIQQDDVINNGSDKATITKIVSSEITVGDVQTVLHNDQTDVNLFTMMVPAEHGDGRDMTCSGQEVISDVAIMLSETVEVETDGMVEVNGTKDAEIGSAPSAGENSPDQKENNCSSSSGKRKHSRSPQSKSKRSKQDPCCEKQPAKGTLSVKGGKWNLRSSRGSASEALRSPTTSK